jgi:hypothetical protein
MLNTIRSSHLAFGILGGCCCFVLFLFFFAVSNSSVETVQSEVSVGDVYMSRSGNKDTFWNNVGNVLRGRGWKEGNFIVREEFSRIPC